MLFFTKIKRKTAAARLEKNRARLRVEALETRLVPYSASTNAWPAPQLITISFAPDGTQLDSNGDTSNLQTSFNASFGSTSAWQNAILKAAQQWARQTNINFAVVGDNGSAFGSNAYQQGDPNVGDIRIAGYNFGSSTLASTYMPPPVNNTSYAGDMVLNTGQTFNNGGGSGYYDLFTVAMHEFGHSLGLYHSSITSATMYAFYQSTRTALSSDDISGIRSIYSAGAARSADSYGGTNSSFANATNISSAISPTSLNGQLTNLNINSTTFSEYFSVTLPAGASGLTVSAQSLGLSLLEPKVTLYASDQVTVLGTASQSGYGGGTATVTYAGAAAGQTFYIKVQGYDTTAFGTGAYDLSLSCGANGLPAVTPPNTQVAAATGSNINFGGGQAIALNPQFQVTGTGTVKTNPVTPRSVAMDGSGNYVVVWSAQNTDGSGWGVYAQRYNATGVAQGAAFLVNTTTAGDQTYPAVAMNAPGAFVVTWSSYGQDGSGWGVYAQRYNAGGIAVGGEFQVNSTTAGDQMYSSVGIDTSGDFVIAWQSNGQDGSGWGVYAQRYNAGGVAVGGEFQVNGTTAGDQTNVSVAMDPTGNFGFAWQSYGQDGSGWGVYADGYTSSGVLALPEFRVNTTTAGDQTNPSIAMNAGDNSVVTWQSNGQDGSGWGVYAQRFSATGAPVGGEFRVNTTTAGDQVHPAAAMDGNGNVVLNWSSYGQDGSGWGVYAQQYDATGKALGTEFRVNTSTAGDQQYVSLAMDSLGDAVAVWTSSGTGSTPGVFGQRYLLNGGSGLAAMTPTDAMQATETAAVQAGEVLPTGGTTTSQVDALFSQTAAAPVVTTGAVPSGASTPTTSATPAHPPGCACALCQRLAQALGPVTQTDPADVAAAPADADLTAASSGGIV